MSYVVLARKYRPRSFAQMVGQEHVVRALTNALQTQRLHHAYLFTGTRGIGKTTVSRILAKSLNCTGADGTGGVTAEPCGVCTACTEIDADRFIDYIELDAASNRGIDEVRDMIERAAYKPSVGRYKVFMIDEAHQLTKEAFNALLKTLEEPPEYLKFVLATTDPEKMLPTVLSRCLQFNLRPIAPDVVREHLERVLEAEGVPADAGSLRLLGRAARGSMRDALSLTDQAIAYGGGRLDEGVVRAMLGAVDRGHAARIVDALARRDGAAVLQAVDALRAQGLSAAATLEEMASILQGMAVEQAVPGALDAGDPDHDDARRLAPALAPDETQLLYAIVVHGRSELSLMSDEYGALTMVLLRMLAFPPAGEGVRATPPRTAVPMPAASSPLASPTAEPHAPPAAAARAPAPEPRPEPRPEAAAPRSPAAPPPRPASPPPSTLPEPPPWLDEAPPDDDGPASAAPRSAPLRAPAPPAISLPAASTCSAPALELTPLGDRWSALARRLVDAGAISALTRELAFQGGLVEAGEGEAAVWRLVVERDSLRAPALVDKLAAALAAELGHPLRLEVQPGVPVDSPSRRDAAERTRRQAEAEDIIRNDPVVQQLLGQFPGAQIVPGSIKPA
jgi:DNA polymerase-3 subunit gamma/tau